MIHGFLVRNEASDECVRGYLYIDGAFFATLEPPWRDNARNVSCICTGTYDVSYLPVSASGKYRKVYHLQDVPNRGGILIHAGNLPKHTKGCILLGKKKSELTGQRAVVQSATAMEELRNVVGPEPFKLTILGWQSC